MLLGYYFSPLKNKSSQPLHTLMCKHACVLKNANIVRASVNNEIHENLINNIILANSSFNCA